MSNDALFEEIEQFLADGGEPPDPTPEEQILAAFQQFNEGIQEFAKAITEVFAPLFDAIVTWVKGVTVRIVQWVTALRREQLNAKLRAWHVPRQVADWLAARWPERWLPKLALGP